MHDRGERAGGKVAATIPPVYALPRACGPGSRKVRRVASHARKQGFQGTDFSMDDLRLLKLAPVFNATIKEVTPTHLVLDLTKKEGADVPYGRIVLHLPKTHLIPENDSVIRKNDS